MRQSGTIVLAVTLVWLLALAEAQGRSAPWVEASSQDREQVDAASVVAFADATRRTTAPTREVAGMAAPRSIARTPGLLAARGRQLLI